MDTTPDPVTCTTCARPVARVTADVDPQTLGVAHRADCGHRLTTAQAHAAWTTHGMRWALPLVDGAALIGAERVRQVVEEGHTAADDAERGPGLAWAAWAYVDRAIHPEPYVEQPPHTWPWAAEEWKPDATPLRRLVIAGALIAAEIDRRLTADRTPAAAPASTAPAERTT